MSEASTAAAVATAPAITELAVIEKDSELLELRTKGAAVAELAKNLEIDSPERKLEGIELVARARRAVKASETRRLALGEPHRLHVASINDLFKKATDPFRTVDLAVTRKVLDFDRAEKKRAADAAAAAEVGRTSSTLFFAEAEKAESAGQPQVAEQLLEKAVASEQAGSVAQAAAVLPARVVETESGTVGTRNKPFTYRVVDEHAVPREFLCLDAGKIRKAINEGARAIAGLEIYQEEGLQVR